MSSMVKSPSLNIKEFYFELITLLVVTLHVLLLVYFVYNRDSHALKIVSERLLVKTIRLKEEPVQKKAVVENVEPERPEPLLVENQTLPEPVEVFQEVLTVEEPPKREVSQEPFKKPAHEPVEKPPTVQKNVSKASSVKPVSKKTVPAKPVPSKFVASKPVAIKPEPVKPALNHANPAKKIETKKINTETSKKEGVQTAKKSEGAPKPKVDPAVEATKAKQRALLESAQKSIAKVDSKIAFNSSQRVDTKMPSTLGNLSIDALPVNHASSMNAREVGYRDELASRLKLLLRLPEHGEVKIKLTLNSSGKFMNVVIVSAQSLENRKYIEKMVPSLTFPSFGSNFSGHNEYTFLITLSNDL
jgi:colicin import membrane protein